MCVCDVQKSTNRKGYRFLLPDAYKAMYIFILGNSKPSNFGKPMDCSHHFHRECYAGFRPTCAYRVLACGGA